MTTYAYLRVSTDAQDVNNQRHGVIEYAQSRGLEPLDFIEDTVSGRKPWHERELGRLLDRAAAGDVLLVAEISRLARSTLQVLEVLQLAANAGIAVHVAKSQMVMDGSLNARITATVLGLAAEIEREFISARTTEALARRRAAGLPLGRPRGARSECKKLDRRRDDIVSLLSKGVHLASIARIVECSRTTLYAWLEANNLKPENTRVPKPASSAAPLPPAAVRGRGTHAIHAARG